VLLVVLLPVPGGGGVVADADLGRLGRRLASLAPEHGVESRDDEHRAQRRAQVQLLAQQQRAQHGHHQQHQRAEHGHEQWPALLHAPRHDHQRDARRENALQTRMPLTTSRQSDHIYAA